MLLARPKYDDVSKIKKRAALEFRSDVLAIFVSVRNSLGFLSDNRDRRAFVRFGRVVVLTVEVINS